MARSAWKSVAATVTAAGLVALAAAPGAAAGPVAQATATGLRLSIGGTAASDSFTGTYAVTHDGERETATGPRNPQITVLGNQSVVQAGTVAQDAATRVRQGRGSSVACAGLAGDGATFVSVEQGDGCLEPSGNLTLNAGNLDLSGLEIVRSDLLQGLDQQLQDALQPILTPVLTAVQDALQQGLTALGDPGLFLDLGAIQSQCEAGPGLTADGAAQLTDVQLRAELPGQSLVLATLPTNPPPNTKVLTDLDVVVESISRALQTNFETALDGALAGAGPLVGQLTTELNANVLSALADQLAPLEENVLDGTLNKQVRPERGKIEVTALDLTLLPAAQDFGFELLATQIGESTCGPSAAVDGPDPEPRPRPTPDVPTSVPAGTDGATAARDADGGLNDLIAAAALGGLLLASGAAGIAAYRRGTRP